MVTAEQILKKWSLPDGSLLKEAAEAAAREYATVKVKEAVSALVEAQVGKDAAHSDLFIHYLLEKEYPLDENIV